MYANLTIALSQTLDSSFFRVWGAIYAGLTLLLWIVVFYKTVVLVPNGRIFNAPCLQETDATAMASSSSQTTRTEQKQEREGEEAPIPPVPVGDELRQEKMSASIC